MLLLLSHIGDVQFIDYEYSGYNYLAYDIGNHFNEFAGKNWIYEVKWTQKKPFSCHSCTVFCFSFYI